MILQILNFKLVYYSRLLHLNVTWKPKRSQRTTSNLRNRKPRTVLTAGSLRIRSSCCHSYNGKTMLFGMAVKSNRRFVIHINQLYPPADTHGEITRIPSFRTCRNNICALCGVTGHFTIIYFISGRPIIQHKNMRSSHKTVLTI